MLMNVDVMVKVAQGTHRMLQVLELTAEETMAIIATGMRFDIRDLFDSEGNHLRDQPEERGLATPVTVVGGGHAAVVNVASRPLADPTVLAAFSLKSQTNRRCQCSKVKSAVPARQELSPQPRQRHGRSRISRSCAR
jgi:hypothetical protein